MDRAFKVYLEEIIIFCETRNYEKFRGGFVGNLINVGRMLLQILSRYLTRVIPLGKGWIKDKRACIRRRD